MEEKWKGIICPGGNEMIRWKKAIVFIEKNGLVFVALAIILFYWAVDIITEGRMVSRLLITISLLAYGIFTQFLINTQKAAKDSLRKSEEEHRIMIETLPLAIFIDIKGKIVYVNPAFGAMFKASSPDEVIGMRLSDFVSPELYDTLQRRRQIMIEEKRIVQPLELNLRCLDGTFITVVSTPIPIIFQDHPAILSALYDVTNRKHSEIELQKAYKLLEIQSKEIEGLRAQLKEHAIRP